MIPHLDLSTIERTNSFILDMKLELGGKGLASFSCVPHHSNQVVHFRRADRRIERRLHIRYLGF